MKMIKGLMAIAMTLVLSSAAVAAPAANSALMDATLSGAQTFGINEYATFCRENPGECLCSVIFGELYCVPK